MNEVSCARLRTTRTMAKMKHKENTATHHCMGGEPAYCAFSMDVKIIQAMKVSRIFIMPGIVERKPLFCPVERRRVKTTSPTYKAKQTQETTVAPICCLHVPQVKKAG